MGSEISTTSTPRPAMESVPSRYMQDVIDLFDVWESVRARNAVLRGYVEMKNKTKDLGISIPPDLVKVNAVVGWADKAMRVRAVRSKFQGFVFEGEQNRRLDVLVRRNKLASTYARACRSALTYGCAAISVMRGTGTRQPPVMVRSFSANQAVMLWDKDACGLGCAIVAASTDKAGVATKYVLHEPDAVVTFAREESGAWSCLVEPHMMGRPLVEPIIHDADDDRPLGHSVITPEVMGIIDKAMRDVLRMEVGAEFFTAPQRYILGADPDLFSPEYLIDAPRNEVDKDEATGEEDDVDDDAPKTQVPPADPRQMMRAYLGAFLALTRDTNGEIPQVGQFPAGDAGNFIAVFENDAQRFSGATNVPLGQLGVLSNNYTSSDALRSTNDPLILEVEQLNMRNGESMEEVARMMMAIDRETSYYDLPDSDMLVTAQFMDPAQPTVSATADAWAKIGGADQSIIGTRVWYEGIGLTKATIDRIMAEKEQGGSIEMLNIIAEALAKGGAPVG